MITLAWTLSLTLCPSCPPPRTASPLPQCQAWASIVFCLWRNYPRNISTTRAAWLLQERKGMWSLCWVRECSRMPWGGVMDSLHWDSESIRTTVGGAQGSEKPPGEGPQWQLQAIYSDQSDQRSINALIPRTLQPHNDRTVYKRSLPQSSLQTSLSDNIILLSGGVASLVGTVITAAIISKLVIIMCEWLSLIQQSCIFGGKENPFP